MCNKRFVNIQQSKILALGLLVFVLQYTDFFAGKLPQICIAATEGSFANKPIKTTSYDFTDGRQYYFLVIITNVAKILALTIPKFVMSHLEAKYTVLISSLQCQVI